MKCKEEAGSGNADVMDIDHGQQAAPCTTEELISRQQSGRLASTSNRPDVPLQWASIHNKVFQHLSSCKRKHSKALNLLTEANEQFKSAQIANDKAGEAFKTILGNKDVRLEVWRATSEDGEIGPASLAAIILYFNGKGALTSKVQLSNEGTGKAQLLTEHEFYAAFLEAFQACQESEKLLHTAKSESLNVANKELKLRDALGFAEALHKAVCSLEPAEGLDVEECKVRFQEVADLCRNRGLPPSTGLDYLLRLLSASASRKVTKRSDSHCRRWFWLDAAGDPQGPFRLVQLVYWLGIGHLKGSDLVWTRKSSEAISVNAAIRGIPPPTKIAQALQPTLASVKRKLASSANINLEALLSEQLEAIFSRTELPPGATQETENGEQHSLQEPCASRLSDTVEDDGNEQHAEHGIAAGETENVPLGGCNLYKSEIGNANDIDSRHQLAAEGANIERPSEAPQFTALQDPESERQKAAAENHAARGLSSNDDAEAPTEGDLEEENHQKDAEEALEAARQEKEKAKEKARLKAENDARRLAVREMRRDNEAQAKVLRAVQKAEKARLQKEVKLSKAAAKIARGGHTPRKRLKVEEAASGPTSRSGEADEISISASWHSSRKDSPDLQRGSHHKQRLSRLESDVDMLKAEVQSMQAAMQQTTHSQGLRQSLRTAERLSRAATPGIPRQSSSQCNSTIAAQTPERDPEPRVRPHPPRRQGRKAVANQNKRRPGKRKRSETDAASNECSARTIAYDVIASQKQKRSNLLPDCPAPNLAIIKLGPDERKRKQRALRGDKREIAKRVKGVDNASFKQLKARTKDLRFGRSPVHAWGLFAKSPIPKEDFVIEYVGETIRSSLEDVREAVYERSGLDSSYLFRVDKETVVDATKKGGLARYINHSCDPNCYTRIVTVEGRKHIAIFSKRDIAPGEELCYDYKFERELDRDPLPCHCGAKTCCGRLN